MITMIIFVFFNDNKAFTKELRTLLVSQVFS